MPPPINTANASRLGLNGTNISINPNAQKIKALGLTPPVPAVSTTGIKAAVPGGLATTQTNTIKKADAAPLVQQTATGNAINSNTVGPGTMGAVMSQAQPNYSQQLTPDQKAALAIGPKPTSTAQYSPNGTYIGTTLPNPTQTGSPTPIATSQGSANALAQTSQNGSQAANMASTGLLNAPSQNALLGQEADNIARQYGQQYNQVGQQGAGFASGQLTTGTSPVAQGNAAITQQTTTAKQNAIAQGEQAALQGIGYQLTAQNQGQQGLETAGNIGNASQGLVQSGLNQAGTLTESQPTAYGQTAFNPATGQFSGAGNIPSDVLQQYAQMAANGQYSAIPSSITGNPVLSAQLNQAAKALNPNYNPITSTAQGAAQASNVQTASTEGVQAGAQLTQQVAGIQSSANGAEANFTLMNNIAKQGGVNDTNVPVLNTLQQNVQKGLTSSSAVTSFQALLQSVRSQYATILGGGTSSVEALQEAQSLIPDNISLGALDSLGTNLKSDAQNRIMGIQQQINTLNNGSSNTGSHASSTSNPAGWF